MLTQLQLSVRTASPNDRQKLANLIHFEVFVHRHLDWRPPLDWIGSHPYLIAEQRGNIIAALACPPDPPEVAWIRVFGAASNISVERAWHALWPEALAMLNEDSHISWAAAIPLQHWFRNLLDRSDFEQTHSIVMLSWENANDSPENGNSRADITLRPMNLDDLGVVEAIDVASFVPVWQNSKPSLELAFRQAAFATIAEQHGKPVGYQISTATPIGGHLARLAVLPSYQGRGIGYALVRDLLSQFARRGAQTVTVNTQQNNDASLSLYLKAGFHFTGEEYPIYQYPIR